VYVVHGLIVFGEEETALEQRPPSGVSAT